MRASLCILLGAAAAVALGACASAPQGSDRFVIHAASYEQAFDASREVLRDRGFQIQRVDARAGVVTTHPKPTAGLATPWDFQQSSIAGEVADLLNQHRRKVRVDFSPVADETALDEGEPDIGPLGAPIPDMREVQSPIQVQVSVYLERVRTPGWRLEPSAITLSSTAQNPDFYPRAMAPTYVQTIRRDDVLAARIGRAIQRRIGALNNDGQTAADSTLPPAGLASISPPTGPR